MNNIEEIWKDIKGYEGLYQVSNLGRVKSLKRNMPNHSGNLSIRNGQILNPFKPGKYYVVKLSKMNKPKNFLVHRLVAESFIQNPDNLPFVNHKDENSLNNCVDNLEWCTAEYNSNYGTRNIRAGLSNIGKKRRMILQYDLEGNLINKWQSVKEIERQLVYNQDYIYSGLSGVHNKVYGFKWEWE